MARIKEKRKFNYVVMVVLVVFAVIVAYIKLF